MKLEIWLPWPPTVNNYYVKTQRGIFISMKGKKFRAQVAEDVIQQLPGVHVTERILVEAILYPPDRRRRDLGNYDKALMDALTHSGLWEDDSLIDQQFFYRGETHKNGCVFMRITPAGPVLPYHNGSELLTG